MSVHCDYDPDYSEARAAILAALATPPLLDRDGLYVLLHQAKQTLERRNDRAFVWERDIDSLLTLLEHEVRHR